MKKLIVVASVILACAVNAATLYWNGGTGGTWNSSNENWTNATGAATAWVRGSDAVIDASAARSIPVKGSVHADNIFWLFPVIRESRLEPLADVG